MFEMWIRTKTREVTVSVRLLVGTARAVPFLLLQQVIGVDRLSLTERRCRSTGCNHLSVANLVYAFTQVNRAFERRIEEYLAEYKSITLP